MKIAIIGCGTMGNLYADRLMKMKHVKLAAALAGKAEDARQFSEKYGVEAFISFDEMMAAANPDVLCITLPTYLHKEFVLKAAAHGKHVICEKPIALNLEDADDMMEACSQRGVKLFIGHVMRFYPEYRNIRNALQAHSIGEVGVVHTKRYAPYPHTPSGWYADPAKSGGIIMDLLIHDIDFLLWTLGDAVSVYAMHRQAAETEYALVTLRFKNGAIANLEGLWGYPGPFTAAAEFAGKQGIIRMDNLSAAPMKVIRREAGHPDSSGVIVPHTMSERDPYSCELTHFLDCIENDKPSIITPNEARKAAEIALAAQSSMASGMPYFLNADPAKESIEKGGLNRG